jgi:hypothetical protein
MSGREHAGESTLTGRIAALRTELAVLERQQRTEDQAAFLLEILRVENDWFTVRTLRAQWAARSLALADQSAKAIGKRLRVILEDQASAAVIPTLRLVQVVKGHKRLWKVESPRTACASASPPR